MLTVEESWNPIPVPDRPPSQIYAVVNAPTMKSALAQMGWTDPSGQVPVVPWAVPVILLGTPGVNDTDIAAHDLSAGSLLTVISVVPANQQRTIWELFASGITGSTRWWVLPATSAATGVPWAVNAQVGSGGGIPLETADAVAGGIHLVNPTNLVLGPGDAVAMTNTAQAGDNAITCRVGFRRVPAS